MASDMSALRHQIVPFGTDEGQIVVLDQGSVITPEAAAMLGALYSRSPKSVLEHLGVIAKRGAAKFMGTYYVGYGHKSIGDMGTAYVFIENVSLLAAKALQDFPLYNGQECSTRYIDYGNRAFLDPLRSERSTAMLARLRSFYLYILSEMVPVLKTWFPIQESDKPEDYEKAIKAYAFDIARAFLPGGASTSLVWSGELRQFADRLPVLRTHPLKEVRDIATAMEQGLNAAYPSSFSSKQYEATDRYLEEMNHRYAYFNPPSTFPEYHANDSRLDRFELSGFRDALSTRPAKVELPYAVRDAGVLRFDYLLDFGSYRDGQRHRALSIRMPLLTTRFGFEPWYLTELTKDLSEKATLFLAQYAADLDSLGLPLEQLQYLVPIGYRVPVRKTGDLRALVYFVELRATSTVHQTLRARAMQMAHTLLTLYEEEGLVLHLPSEVSRFDVKRGTQDIVKKS